MERGRSWGYGQRQRSSGSRQHWLERHFTGMPCMFSIEQWADLAVLARGRRHRSVLGRRDLPRAATRESHTFVPSRPTIAEIRGWEGTSRSVSISAALSVVGMACGVPPPRRSSSACATWRRRRGRAPPPGWRPSPRAPEPPDPARLMWGACRARCGAHRRAEFEIPYGNVARTAGSELRHVCTISTPTAGT